MDNVVLETLARIAGIGGVAVGILLFLFREVLRRTVFSRISPDHSFQLLRLVVVFTGVVAIGGLATWAITAQRNDGLNAPAALLSQTSQTSRSAQLRVPIDNLFNAWEAKDLNAYIDQWHPAGRQWVGAKSRSLPEIADRRRVDFTRYQTVQVIDHKVDVEDATSSPVTARVTYSMRFQRPDGSWIQETDMRETYKLVFQKERSRWVIMENFDYFAK